MHYNPDNRNPTASTGLATATGAHLFQLTRGEQLAGGVGGIARDPAVWGGRAVIQGTRIPVFVIVDQFQETGTVEGVLEAYPDLKPADVHVALAYADLDGEGIARDRATYLEQIPPEARIGE